MIVIVAGTNGSGKTTLMRRVIDVLGEPQQQDKMFMEWDNVVIVGKYDGPHCGGCDGFSWKGAADDIEALVTSYQELGKHVLLEGVIVSTWGMARLKRLAERGLVVIHLTTPVDVCEASVNERRKVRMGEKYTPVKPDNLRSKHAGLERGVEKRRAEGIDVRRFDREAAFAEIRGMLQL